MAPRRFVRKVILSLSMLPVAATLGLATSCRDPAAEPKIGFTYNWGEPGLIEFLQAEVERRAPVGSLHVRVVPGSVGDWRQLASTSLAAEVNRALALADDPNVIVVVGPGGSREALQVAPIFRRAGVTHLVPTATSRLLSDAGEWTLVMAPNDSLQGEFIGAFADTALHAKRAVVFYAPDEYGVGLAAGTAAVLAARGVTLVDRVPVRPNLDCGDAAGVTVYRQVAAELALREPPDVVISAARSMETACLMRALRVRWPSLRLVAGDGAYVDAAYIARAGESPAESYFVAFWHPSLGDASEASQAFAEGFHRATGRAARHGDAIFFDAVMVAAEAIREVGPDREAVRDYLKTLGGSRPAPPGVAGPITFPGASRKLLMTRLDGRTVRVVGTR